MLKVCKAHRQRSAVANLLSWCPLGLVSVLVLGVASLGLAGCPGKPGEVGTNVCLQCHNGVLAPDRTAFRGNPHAAIGCEGCHGPGLAHVRNGGRGGLFINALEGLDFQASVQFCGDCHEETAAQHLSSVHGATESLTCLDCHDVHGGNVIRGTVADNGLCLNCHEAYGFASDAEIEAHTFHPVDPEGTGASRCTLCHMPPLVRVDQASGPRSHSMQPIPPVESNNAADEGVTPVPPNSCSGITGCHDGTVPTAPVFDVENREHNDLLQILYDTRYGEIL